MMIIPHKNILLVEDEVLIAKDIKRMLEPKYHVVGMTKTYDDTIAALKRYPVDLVILDIKLLGDKNGVDVANYINKELGIPFIYLTAQTSDNSLEQLKGTKPAAYIAKPVIKASLITTLDIVFSKIEEKTIYLHVGKKVHAIDLDKILFAKAEHVYVKICTLDGCQLIRYSLSKFLNEANGKLLKINRSTAVNPKFIKRMDSKEVLVGDETFLVSSKNREKLFEKFVV